MNYPDISLALGMFPRIDSLMFRALDKLNGRHNDDLHLFLYDGNEPQRKPVYTHFAKLYPTVISEQQKSNVALQGIHSMDQLQLSIHYFVHFAGLFISPLSRIHIVLNFEIFNKILSRGDSNKNNDDDLQLIEFLDFTNSCIKSARVVHMSLSVAPIGSFADVRLMFLKCDFDTSTHTQLGGLSLRFEPIRRLELQSQMHVTKAIISSLDQCQSQSEVSIRLSLTPRPDYIMLFGYQAHKTSYGKRKLNLPFRQERFSWSDDCSRETTEAPTFPVVPQHESDRPSEQVWEQHAILRETYLPEGWIHWIGNAKEVLRRTMVAEHKLDKYRDLERENNLAIEEDEQRQGKATDAIQGFAMNLPLTDASAQDVATEQLQRTTDSEADPVQESTQSSQLTNKLDATEQIPRMYREEVTKEIGKDGGFLETCNYSLNIPENGLKQPFAIKAEELSPFDYLSQGMLHLIHKKSIEIGPLLSLTPHGMKFEIPVKVTSSYHYNSCGCMSARPVVLRCERLGKPWIDVSDASGLHWESEELSFNVREFSFYLIVLLRLPDTWLQLETLENYQNDRVHRPIFQLWKNQNDNDDQACLLTVATAEQKHEASVEAEAEGYSPISQEVVAIPYIVTGANIIITTNRDGSSDAQELTYCSDTHQKLYFEIQRPAEVHIGFQDGHEQDCSKYIELEIFRCHGSVVADVEAPGGTSSEGISTARGQMNEDRRSTTYDFGILAPETLECEGVRQDIIEMLELSGLKVFDNRMKRLGTLEVPDTMESYGKCRNFIVVQGSKKEECFKLYLKFLMATAKKRNRECCLIQCVDETFEHAYMESCQVVNISYTKWSDEQGMFHLDNVGHETVRANVASVYDYEPTDLIVPERVLQPVPSRPRKLLSTVILGRHPSSIDMTKRLRRVGLKVQHVETVEKLAQKVSDFGLLVCIDIEEFEMLELVALYAVCHNLSHVVPIKASELSDLESSGGRTIKDFVENRVARTISDTCESQRSEISLEDKEFVRRCRGVLDRLASNSTLKDVFAKLQILIPRENQLRATAVWSSLELALPKFFRFLPSLQSRNGKLLSLAAQLVDLGHTDTERCLAQLQVLYHSTGLAEFSLSREGINLESNFKTTTSASQHPPNLLQFTLEEIAIYLHSQEDPEQEENITSVQQWVPNAFYTLDRLALRFSEGGVDLAISERYMIQDALKTEMTMSLQYQARLTALFQFIIDRLFDYQLSVFNDKPLLCPRMAFLPVSEQRKDIPVDSAFKTVQQLAERNHPVFLSLDCSISEQRQQVLQALRRHIGDDRRLGIIVHKVFHHSSVTPGLWKTTDFCLVLEMIAKLHR